MNEVDEGVSLPSATTELRKRLPAARRRSQLLEVALDRFAANGFHRTSMEEIADAAGVTKSVLYQHFGSKQTLYLELVERMGQSCSTRSQRGRRPSTTPTRGYSPAFAPTSGSSLNGRAGCGAGGPPRRTPSCPSASCGGRRLAAG